MVPPFRDKSNTTGDRSWEGDVSGLPNLNLSRALPNLRAPVNWGYISFTNVLFYDSGIYPRPEVCPEKLGPQTGRLCASHGRT